MRRMMMVAAVAAVATAASCGGVGKQMFAQPDVTVKDVKVTGLGLAGGSVDVVMNVHNPNNFRLDATRVTYNLLVDTVSFATGSLDSRTTMEAGKDTEVRIPVNFTYAGIGSAGKQLLAMGSVPYRVTGDIVVGTVLGNFTVPYDKAGRFSPAVRFNQ
ncbi:MAG TPA: LEA type 2 family protein [Gemmatimonadaceae bacterium]|nr:LEA type 2 family protein [Gemmatimonadaceae bacterium]